MKKYFAFVLVLFSSVHFLFAQTPAHEQIKKATDDLNKKNYKSAQQNLLNAISSINKIMAKEILDSLPKKVNDMIADVSMDQNTSMSSTNSGFSVNRMFTDGNGKSLNISVMENSPITQSVKMMMKDSTLLPPGSEQKLFMLNEFKSLKHYDESNSICNYEIAFDSSIVIINFDGFPDEKTCDEYVAKINLAKIRNALGE